MKNLIKIFTPILSLLLFSIYIWIRFIRERLPTEIPFTLSEFRFILLVYIIGIHLFILYVLITQYQSSSHLPNKIRKILFKFFKIITDHIILNQRTRPYFNIYFRKLLVFLDHTSMLKIYNITNILPRVILISIFSIEVLFFNRINYFYKWIPLGFILLVINIIYMLLEDILHEEVLEMNFTLLTYSEPHGRFLNLEPKAFIILQANQYNKGKSLIDGHLILTFDYLEKLRKDFNLDPKQRVDKVIDLNALKKELKLNLITPITIQSFLLSYDESATRCKAINVMIYSLYLICWSYILITSLDTLTDLPTLRLIIPEMIEPFSDIYL